jgi:rhomboid family GlyGly-CTERM serine protease
VEPFCIALAAMVAGLVLMQCLPGLQGLLEYNRQAITSGQWHRLITGNLVHWSWTQLAGDVAVFAAMAWVVWRRGGPVPAMSAALALAVALAILLTEPHVNTYRGLSGISYGLLSWALVGYARSGSRAAVPAAMVLAVIVLKTIAESVVGGQVIPGWLPTGVRMVVASHAAGVAVGIAWGLIARGVRVPEAGKPPTGHLSHS